MIKKIITIFILFLYLGTKAAQTQDLPPSKLIITADTVIMHMAGMPDLTETSKQLNSFEIPSPESYFSTDRKKFKVRFWTPSEAPKEASAKLLLPNDLKLGESIKLHIARPEEGLNSISAEEIPEELSDITVKYYWGCGEEINPEQESILKWDSIPDMQKSAIIRQIYSDKGSFFYKPDWSIAFYPNEKETKKIDRKAKLAGKYKLITNYAGEAEITIPESADFLKPFIFTSPNLNKSVPFDKPITFKWKPINNILGINALIIGTSKDGTITIWSSSEVSGADIIPDEYPDREMIKKMTEDGILMPADQTEMKIPAKIFSSCDSVFMIMNGYGNEISYENYNIITQIKTKTSVMVMLKSSVNL